jgi:hypothetical protein
MAKAGDTDPAKVLRALAGTERFEGVTGTLSYSGGSRIPTKSVEQPRLRGGKRKLIRQLTPERVPGP